MGAVAMFLFKEGSRNAFNPDRKEKTFRKNYERCFKMQIPHLDATEDVFRLLKPEELERTKAIFISNLIERKVFHKFKFMGKRYKVTVDATGVISYDHQHCEECCFKTSKNDVKTWFHNVLEAKLVTSNGFCISLASEWIANSEIDYKKQDCEQTAFKRLAKKLKSYFPRLPIVILADGLYPNQTFFEICKSNNWNFIVTFEDGNLPTIWQEINLLPASAKRTHENIRYEKNKKISKKYSICNNLDYNKYTINWAECIEEIENIKTKEIQLLRFVYVTDIKLNTKNIEETVKTGRERWKTENEGFNEQKNNGYELEHQFSRVSFNAMKNWYLCLQLAHLINQLTLLAQNIKELIEKEKITIKCLWKKLYGTFTFTALSEEDIFDSSQGRIQVRF